MGSKLQRRFSELSSISFSLVKYKYESSKYKYESSAIGDYHGSLNVSMLKCMNGLLWIYINSSVV